MSFTDKPLWRKFAWPVLFFSAVYFLLYPDWHNALAHAYNEKDELSVITDREGNVRRLFYEDPDFDHYLTRMEIERGDGETTVVAYDYDDRARLGSIDTGAGEIAMEYEDAPGGGGRQTVVDEAAGGRTEVEYDAAGRVTRQIDPAGVETAYEYFADESANPDTQPAGALKAQTVGGVRTEFSYDLSPYNLEYYGIEGIARQFVDFWFFQASGGELINDYDQQDAIKPGYLTAAQVQPTEVATPAVGPDGVEIPGVGNAVAIGYAPGVGKPDGTGKIYGVTDPEGRNFGLTYGANAARNEMTEITGPGTRIENSYLTTGTFTGRLQQSTMLRNGETLSTTIYNYAVGTVSDFIDLKSELETISNIADLWPDYASAWIEEQTVTLDDGSSSPRVNVIYLDANSKPIARKDEEGGWTITLRNANERIFYVRSAIGAITEYVYDPAGLLLSRIETDPDGTSRATAYEYDENLRPTSVLEDGEVRKQFAYEETSGGQKRLSEIDREGNRTITVFDTAERLVRKRVEGVLGGVRETVYGYDELGRRNSVRHPDGQVTLYEFDAAGRETASRVLIDGLVQETARGYDRFGRVIWSQSPVQAIADPPLWTTYAYNTSVPTVDPAYGKKQKVYFADSDKDPSNNETYSGPYESYEYDNRGLLTAVLKPVDSGEGTIWEVKTSTSHDEKDRIASVVLNDVDAAGDSTTEDLSFQFTYDEEGIRDSITFPSGLVKQWNRTYIANALNQVVETHPGGAIWKQTDFDDRSKSLRQTDAAGNVIEYAYQGSTLERKTYTKAGSSSPDYNHTFVYDANGDLLEVRTSSGEANQGDLRIEFRQYDPETGQVKSANKPEGNIDYAYDKIGRISAISYLGQTTLIEYNGLGKIERVKSAEGEWIYSYNQAGLPASVENLAQDSIRRYEYDGLGRLKRLVHEKITGEKIFEVEYQIGIDGNRIGALERRGDTATRWIYRYDPLQRLVGEKRDVNDDGSFERDLAYTYNADSNRKTVVDNINPENSETYFYVQGTHRLDRIERGPPGNQAIHKTFAYTPNGELASQTDADGTTSYTWNPEDLLSSVTLPDGRRIEYDYDFSGQLVARRHYDASGNLASHRRYLVETEEVFGRSQILAEIDGQSGAAVRFHTAYESPLVSTEISARSSANDFFHADGLGSIRAVSFESEENPETLDFGAFGDAMQPAPDETYLAFAGELRDGLTDLQYHRARWYSPALSVWLSADVRTDFPENFGNPYSYVGQNPINRIDPTGTITSMAEASVVNVGMGHLSAAARFKIGNLPFGMSVVYEPADAGLARQLLTIVIIAFSFVPIIGSVFDAIELKTTLTSAIDIVSGRGEFEPFEIAVTFLILAITLIAIIIPGGRFVKGKLDNALDWVKARRAARFAEVGTDAAHVARRGLVKAHRPLIQYPIDAPGIDPPALGPRHQAVREAKKQEMELVRKSGRGTRDWTEAEIEQLKRGEWPKDSTGKAYVGHHINNVNHHPEWRGDPRDIRFLTEAEHTSSPLGHGGKSTREPTRGLLIDRQKMIEALE